MGPNIPHFFESMYTSHYFCFWFVLVLVWKWVITNLVMHSACQEFIINEKNIRIHHQNPQFWYVLDDLVINSHLLSYKNHISNFLLYKSTTIQTPHTHTTLSSQSYTESEVWIGNRNKRTVAVSAQNHFQQIVNIDKS